MSIDRLFNPRSIAIIGASRTPTKVGYHVVKNIIDSKFSGQVIPINPKYRSILGLRCYESLTVMSRTVDVAMIVIPAPFVPAVLEECGRAGVRFAVIISSGFKESGAAGKSLETEIHSIAARYGMRILGPNCLGFINTHKRLNASFAASYPARGTVSFVSQSGAMLVSLIDWSLESGMGLNVLVSLGNETDLTETEVIEHLAEDPNTAVIGLYVERISNIPRFMSAVSHLSRKKPVIAIHAGKTQAGVQAVNSHTGSLASSDVVVSTALRQAGVIEVSDIEDLFNGLKIFSLGHNNPSREVVVISNAGGPAIIAVDEIARSQLSLAAIPEIIQKRIARALPAGAAVRNPIDLVGDADFNRFKKTLDIIIKDTTAGNICLLLTPQAGAPLVEVANYLVAAQRAADKFIVACYLGGGSVRRARDILNKGGVTHFQYPYDAIRILSRTKDFYSPVVTRSYSSVKTLAAVRSTRLPYADVQTTLVRFGFPLVKALVLSAEDEISRIAQYPVVMKIIADRVIHKWAAGGVILNIADERAARSAYRSFQRSFQGQGFHGVIVQPMVAPGREFIIGAKRDSNAGPVLMAGIGGTYAEQLHDVTFTIGRVDRREARRMLLRLRNQDLLQDVDRQFLTMLLEKTSKLLEDRTDIQELDFNPVTVYTKGGIIVDARISVSSKK